MLTVKKTNTPIVQICFTLKNNLTMDTLRTKLQDTKTKLDNAYPNGYLVKSCHLNRDICEEQGFSTEIPDLFEEIFGKTGYQCELTETTMEAAKKNMQMHREHLSKTADTLVVLSETALTNVALEIQLFTDNHIMIV